MVHHGKYLCVNLWSSMMLYWALLYNSQKYRWITYNEQYTVVENICKILFQVQDPLWKEFCSQFRQPEFCKWAFNVPRGEACLSKWEMIPSDTDILITHTPPVGHGDLCCSGVRAGCVELLSTVQNRVKPKYHVFGHIHEGMLLQPVSFSKIKLVFPLL